MVKNYKDLQVWQKSIRLVSDIYEILEYFPSEEKYGLVLQIKLSAILVPSNIAEGHSRWYTKEFLHHLSISYGSLAELETQLIIAIEINIVNQNAIKSISGQIEEIGKMINGLRNKLSPDS